MKCEKYGVRNNSESYFLLFIFHSNYSKLVTHRLSVWTVVVLSGWFCILGGLVWAQGDREEYVRAIEEDIQQLQVQAESSPKDPRTLSDLARLYLQLGGISQDSIEDRITLHEKGTQLAKQALALQENLADAHFYYAANLGSATQLRGVMASAFVVEELKLHAKRAVELQSDHSPALHMLGRMLDELPWFLGGDEDVALRYLEKAVSADEHNAHARLDLAKLYLERKQVVEARKELQEVVQHVPLEQNWNWTFQHKPEAERLLRELENSRTSLETR